MSTNDPDQIRREIDQTRSNLSYNVNALADEASPRSIARRQVRRVRSSAWSLRERLFGSDEDHANGGGNAALYDEYSYGTGTGVAPSVRYDEEDRPGITQQAREGVGDLAHNVRDTAADAPRQIRRQTQGAPLTLGLIAFGLGGLVAAMLPPSDKEREAAAAVKEQAAPLVEEAKAVAQESVENIRPAAQDAVASVQDSARTAADVVKEDARASAETVKDDAARAKDDVKGQQGATGSS